MPNPLLLDIVLYLQALGIVEGDGLDCFRDFSPEEPDDIVLLMEYTGAPMIPQDPATHRSVQISTRSKDPDVARARALQLCNSFRTEEETRRINFTADRWGQVYVRQPPFRIKLDENNRTVYGFNIGVTTTID